MRRGWVAGGRACDARGAQSARDGRCDCASAAASLHCTHAARLRRARGARVGDPLVARAARRAGVHGAAGGARAGRRRAGGRRRAAAHAHRLRLRVRGGRQLRGVRRRVRCAHEPGRHGGGAGDRPAALGACRRVRGGAVPRRRARVRRAAGRHAGAVGAAATAAAAGDAGRDAAERGGRRERAGGARDRSRAHGPAGARVLRRVAGARHGAPRPRHAHQAGSARRWTHLRRGSGDGRQPQPGAQPRARALAPPMEAPVGVLGGPAGRRGVRGRAAPLGADPARDARARAPSARGAAALGQALTGVGRSSPTSSCIGSGLSVYMSTTQRSHLRSCYNFKTNLDSNL